MTVVTDPSTGRPVSDTYVPGKTSYNINEPAKPIPSSVKNDLEAIPIARSSPPRRSNLSIANSLNQARPVTPIGYVSSQPNTSPVSSVRFTPPPTPTLEASLSRKSNSVYSPNNFKDINPSQSAVASVPIVQQAKIKSPPAPTFKPRPLSLSQ